MGENMIKELGKIYSLSFGDGGYQDAMFGFSFELSGDGWGTGDFWGWWSSRHEGAQWTTEDQNKKFLDGFLRVKDLMRDAKKSELYDLVGVPIEATFEDNRLVSWRILKEVL